ncbi:trans-sulfuration enzyme family protein [Aureivirga sp. CE67]|uniref:trans-sulfuration enzyme family protein n=1 Tax=Aureivirga sp. CE67 TaxID=1788983 RepID=UPI0018C9547B|nr:aminotransferase class I/II-fold pyridoxal phosphate-dependent enzyme [Aureivirga sp. CE67]
MAANFETKAIRTEINKSENKEHTTPLYVTSSFTFENPEQMAAAFSEEIDRNIYSRFTNPNNTEFIQKMCALENAEDGYAFATGMAAIFNTFAALLNSGDHIVSCKSVFGSTHSLFTTFLPKWNIETSYFGTTADSDEIESLIQENTKILFVETPTNPGVEVVDLEKLNAIAKKHNLIFIVDNCFATPYLQNPINFGADLVLHSATKLIDGQGRVLGGIVVGKKEYIREIYLFARNTGSSLSPFNAWILSKSLETLALRVEKHCENALKIAEYLEKHPKIKSVKYPFLKSHPQYEIAKKQMRKGGNIIAFELKEGLEAGKQLLKQLKLASLTANLGDTRTIVTHPASTTHSKLSSEERNAAGIADGLVRLSVGLEHYEDVIEDLEQGLN